MNGRGLKVLAKLLACGLGVTTLASCGLGATSGQTESRKLVVLTSFLPIYSFTANVAGDNASVENLLPGGMGPHEYQFSRKDLQKLQKADLIIINGAALEPWLGKVLANVKGSKTVVEASSGLEGEFLYLANGEGGQPGKTPNPHLWLDPRLACRMAGNISAALQRADPAHAGSYKANAQQYLDRLEKLDTEMQTALAPYAGAAIITFHDAFPYFARRYRLKISGVIEVVPDVNPSPRHLAALAQAARRDKVKVIFTEPLVSSRLVKQFSQDLGLPLATLDTLETGPLRPTAYEEAMRKNLQTLLLYLKASSPEGSK